jgi:flagellar motor switch protein FliG
VLKLFAKLDRIKEDPSVYADGPSLAADFLKNLPAGREEELLTYLLTDHPEEAEKLRKVKVLFQDIPYYPEDIARKVIESTDPEDLTKALVGYDHQFAESFLALLPTKRALMIQNDLFHLAEYPPASQCAEMRRKICNALEAEFAKQKFDLSDFWKSNSESAEVYSLNPDSDEQDKVA